MKKWALLSMLLTISTGCSVIMATQQPGKKNLSVLSEGVNRSQVIAELGAPLTTEEKDGLKEDTFAFKQGYSTGAKAARGVFHAAADVFTCGLWELIGTPAEAIASGTEIKVRVCYDKNGMVTKVIPYSGKEKIDEATLPAKETVKE